MKKYIALVLTLITVFALISGCSSAALNVGNQNPDYFLIRNYYGRTHQDAVNETKENLNIKVIDVYSAEQKAGVIINQYPYVGKEVFTDSDLTLYISNGESPDGFKLDGLDYSSAEEILKQTGAVYSVENVYNINVEQGHVFGLGQNGDEYILYVSLGQPELSVSGKPGYAAKSGDYVFYTDDKHIYRMNADGTTKRTLVDASGMNEIIPYEDWIVYLDREKTLHIVNWEDRKKSKEVYNVDIVFKVIDDMVYFEDEDGFEKYSLLSGNIYVVEKRENKITISDVIFKNNSLFYIHGYENRDNQTAFELKCLNCFTGEKEILDDNNEVYDVLLYNNNICYTNKFGLYLLDESKSRVN